MEGNWSNGIGSKHISLFSLMIIFILSVLTGILISIMLKTETAYLTPENNLPVSQELLQNPLFSSWSAHVSGRVIAKTNSTFTISHIIEEFSNRTRTIKDANDGKTLEITYIPEMTVLKKDPRIGSQQFALYELAIDSIVNGNVKILQSDNQMKINGGVFFIQ